MVGVQPGVAPLGRLRRPLAGERHSEKQGIDGRPRKER